jgi:hypothetical protein
MPYHPTQVPDPKHHSETGKCYCVLHIFYRQSRKIPGLYLRKNATIASFHIFSNTVLAINRFGRLATPLTAEARIPHQASQSVSGTGLSPFVPHPGCHSTNAPHTTYLSLNTTSLTLTEFLSLGCDDR